MNDDELETLSAAIDFARELIALTMAMVSAHSALTRLGDTVRGVERMTEIVVTD